MEKTIFYFRYAVLIIAVVIMLLVIAANYFNV